MQKVVVAVGLLITLKKIRAMVYIPGQTEESMKVNGSLENSMERANISCWMARLKWGSGKMVRELNGLMNKKMLHPKIRTKNERGNLKMLKVQLEKRE